MDTVQQADMECDFDFLDGPPPSATAPLVRAVAAPAQDPEVAHGTP